MINVCIIDDDQRLANQIKAELQHYPELGWIKTSESGLDYIHSLQNSSREVPDCILMDISMKVADEGILATRLAVERFPQIKIVMFTISDDDDRVFEAFKAGAVGYLMKNERPAFIFRAISEVMNGGALMSPAIALKTIKFMTGGHQQHEQHDSFNLTERELEILRLISKGLRYQQIADQLFISDQTVKKHISNIFHKLHVNNKVEAIIKSKGLL